MDKAKILRLLEKADDIVSALYRQAANRSYKCKSLREKLKSISAEITAPPKTNADRIRQMTDAELAEMLLLSTCYFGCNKCKYHGKCKGKSCTEAALEWLKQEVSKDVGTD